MSRIGFPIPCTTGLIASLLLACSLLLTAFSASALEPFSHEYKSKFAGFGAKSFRTLSEIEPGIWEFSMSSRNMFARYKEVSRFRLDESGYPVPLENYIEGRLFGVKRTERTEFDWDAGVATWYRKEDVRSVDIEPGMVDRILYQLLVPGHAATGVEEISYQFINRGQLKSYDFKRIGPETLTIGGQDIDTVKITRIDDNQEKETSVWLAPEMNYELIRIYHHDKDGADYEMELKL